MAMAESARIMRLVPLALAAALAASAAGVVAQDVPRPAPGPERFDQRIVAAGLEAPWEIAWGPDEQLWITERRGRRVVRVNPATGLRATAVTIDEVHQSVSQDGLLGLALHPQLLRGSDFVYVAFTYDDAPGPELRRRLLVRQYSYDASARALVRPVDLLSGLPAHNDHQAGRLAVGPDGKLYLSIGDLGSNFGGNR